MAGNRSNNSYVAISAHPLEKVKVLGVTLRGAPNSPSIPLWETITSAPQPLSQWFHVKRHAADRLSKLLSTQFRQGALKLIDPFTFTA